MHYTTLTFYLRKSNRKNPLSILIYLKIRVETTYYNIKNRENIPYKNLKIRENVI